MHADCCKNKVFLILLKTITPECCFINITRLILLSLSETLKFLKSQSDLYTQKEMDSVFQVIICLSEANTDDTWTRGNGAVLPLKKKYTVIPHSDSPQNNPKAFSVGTIFKLLVAADLPSS